MNSATDRKNAREALEEKRRRIEEMKKMREERGKTGPNAAVEPFVDAASVAIEQPKTNPVINAIEDSSPSIETKIEIVPVAPLKKVVLSTITGSVKVNIAPEIRVSYDKGCQTDEDILPSLNFDDNMQEETAAVNRRSVSFRKENPLTAAFSAEATDDGEFRLHTKKMPSAIATHNFHDRAAEVEVLREATLKDKHFIDFVATTSLYIERALEQNKVMDILHNYGSNEDNASNKSSQKDTFEVLPSFEVETVVNRPVMDVQWSTLCPELFLVAYGARQASITNSAQNKVVWSMSNNSDDESPGCLCVWSKELHSRPEFRFFAPSPVQVAIFHNQDSHIILGGCYSGQIMLWDMRQARSGNCIQCSSIAGKGHKYPIYALSFVSSASDELLSISANGMLCRWDTKHLTEPLVVLTMNVSQSAPTSQLELSLSAAATNSSVYAFNISAMAVGNLFETSQSVILGCGSGKVVRYTVPVTSGVSGGNSSQGDQVFASGHNGLVTAIHTHPSVNHKRYKNLVLTSSLDWTVKLWSLDSFSKPLLEFATTSYSYIVDVQWCPSAALVFVTLSSAGTVSIWNLSKSTAVPVDSITVNANIDLTAVTTAVTKPVGRSGAAAVRTYNKVLWSKDGSGLFVCDSIGTTHALRVNPAVLNVSSDESGFENTILAGLASVNTASTVH